MATRRLALQAMRAAVTGARHQANGAVRGFASAAEEKVGPGLVSHAPSWRHTPVPARAGGSKRLIMIFSESTQAVDTARRSGPRCSAPRGALLLIWQAGPL